MTNRIVPLSLALVAALAASQASFAASPAKLADAAQALPAADAAALDAALKGGHITLNELVRITATAPAQIYNLAPRKGSLAIGAEATFVARAVDSDRAGLTEVLTAAAAHRGASFVEIYQNCPIFNDGAYDAVKGRDADDTLIRHVHGEPIVFAGGSKGVVRDPATAELSIVDDDAVGIDAILVHDAHREDPGLAFSLTRLAGPGVVRIAPVGIFRDVGHPSYDDLARQQLAAAGPSADPEAALQGLIRGAETWTVL